MSCSLAILRSNAELSIQLRACSLVVTIGSWSLLTTSALLFSRILKTDGQPRTTCKARYWILRKDFLESKSGVVSNGNRTTRGR